MSQKPHFKFHELGEVFARDFGYSGGESIQAALERLPEQHRVPCLLASIARNVGWLASIAIEADVPPSGGMLAGLLSLSREESSAVPDRDLPGQKLLFAEAAGPQLPPVAPTGPRIADHIIELSIRARKIVLALKSPDDTVPEIDLNQVRWSKGCGSRLLAEITRWVVKHGGRV